jgi:hypothetical protein
MKNIKSLLVAALSSVAVAAAVTYSPQDRTLVWDYTVIGGTNNTVNLDVTGFNIYASSDVTMPLYTWPLFTNLMATNLQFKASGTGLNITNTYSITWSQVPQLQFFVITATNTFYKVESDFSNVALTPAPPQTPQRLLIK